MRTLVYMPNWLGDAVMATSALQLLHSQAPDDHLTVFGTSSVCEMLTAQPWVHEVVEYARHRYALNQFYETVCRLRAGHFERVFLFPNSFASAWVMWWAKIPTRVGYHCQWRRALLTHPITPLTNPKNEHHRFFYARIVTPNFNPNTVPAPRLVVTQEMTDSMYSWCSIQGIDTTRHLVALAPGAHYGSAKRWHHERFAQLAQRLIQQTNTTVVVLGGEQEVSTCQALVSQVNHPLCRSVAGQLSLRESMALMSICRVMIANDSGPMHIAAALGVPTVAIFGSTNPSWTGPAGAPVTIIQHQVHCTPCYLRECPRQRECFEGISVQQVTNAAIKYILNTGTEHERNTTT